MEETTLRIGKLVLLIFACSKFYQLFYWGYSAPTLIQKNKVIQSLEGKAALAVNICLFIKSLTATVFWCEDKLLYVL